MSTLVHWHSAGMAEVPADRTWHDPALAARLGSMRYTKRRDEAELGRWTAKQALARFLTVDPGDLAALRAIAVRNAPDGAPEAFAGGEPARVRIAMTDRADWAVCAVMAGDDDIGCDLELVEPRSAAFVRDYFTAREQALVAAFPDRNVAANLVWSAKESALKVLRTGLRRDTRTVEVTLSHDSPPLGTGWQPLVVRDIDGGAEFPGYWVRYGDFVLTIATRSTVPPPISFDDPPGLASAQPSHGWMERPHAAAD